MFSCWDISWEKLAFTSTMRKSGRYAMHHPRTNIKELRSFIDLASYSRRFIKGYAKIANQSTEQNPKIGLFEWTLSMQNAFETLKESLTTAPVLPYPDQDRLFIVVTDASSKAIRGLLSLLNWDGRGHPIHYASCGLTSPLRNYATKERVALAIIFA